MPRTAGVIGAVSVNGVYFGFVNGINGLCKVTEKPRHILIYKGKSVFLRLFWRWG
jgi:hypothetical protein